MLPIHFFFRASLFFIYKQKIAIACGSDNSDVMCPCPSPSRHFPEGNLVNCFLLKTSSHEMIGAFPGILVYVLFTLYYYYSF